MIDQDALPDDERRAAFRPDWVNSQVVDKLTV